MGKLRLFKDHILFKLCYCLNFTLHRREVCVAVEMGKNGVFSILDAILQAPNHT